MAKENCQNSGQETMSWIDLDMFCLGFDLNSFFFKTEECHNSVGALQIFWKLMWENRFEGVNSGKGVQNND